MLLHRQDCWVRTRGRHEATVSNQDWVDLEIEGSAPQKAFWAPHSYSRSLTMVDLPGHKTSLAVNHVRETGGSSREYESQGSKPLPVGSPTKRSWCTGSEVNYPGTVGPENSWARTA